MNKKEALLLKEKGARQLEVQREVYWKVMIELIEHEKEDLYDFLAKDHMSLWFKSLLYEQGKNQIGKMFNEFCICYQQDESLADQLSYKFINAIYTGTNSDKMSKKKFLALIEAFKLMNVKSKNRVSFKPFDHQEWDSAPINNYRINTYMFDHFNLPLKSVISDYDADKQTLIITKKLFFQQTLFNCYLLNCCFEAYVSISLMASERALTFLPEHQSDCTALEFVEKINKLNSPDQKAIMALLKNYRDTEYIEQNKEIIKLYESMKQNTLAAKHRNKNLVKEDIWNDLSKKLYEISPEGHIKLKLTLNELEAFIENMQYLTSINEFDWDAFIEYYSASKKAIIAFTKIIDELLQLGT